MDSIIAVLFAAGELALYIYLLVGQSTLVC